MVIFRKPRIGDIKTGVSFAYFPVFLSNGDLIWLEKYKWTKIYQTRCMDFPTWMTDRRRL